MHFNVWEKGIHYLFVQIVDVDVALESTVEELSKVDVALVGVLVVRDVHQRAVHLKLSLGEELLGSVALHFHHCISLGEVPYEDTLMHLSILAQHLHEPLPRSVGREISEIYLLECLAPLLGDEGSHLDGGLSQERLVQSQDSLDGRRFTGILDESAFALYPEREDVPKG